MSTNKTEHFGLHSWAAGDDFLRAEINENFEMLDGAVVSGSYAGNGGSQAVELGFQPRMLLMLSNDGFNLLGAPGAGTGFYGQGTGQTVVAKGTSAAVRWTDTGFTAVGKHNMEGYSYSFWALK